MPHIGPNVTLNEPAFIHETAQIQGKVYLGRGVSVWTYAVTRSEVYEIRIGARTNIQDFVMIHEGSGFPTIVGEDCSITHHVTLHGCEIGDRKPYRHQRDHHGRRKDWQQLHCRWTRHCL